MTTLGLNQVQTIFFLYINLALNYTMPFIWKTLQVVGLRRYPNWWDKRRKKRSMAVLDYQKRGTGGGHSICNPVINFCTSLVKF